jgi:hypothetical protein
MIAAVGSFIAAIAGVAMRHAHKAQRGEKFIWSRIWLDAPTVFVMGLTGSAAGQWLHGAYGMPELFGGVIAASLGYLGPSAVDRALEYLEKRKGSGDK